ncbi:MAG: aquaporin [Chloroflexi bacterium]|nr:aquaporin [Chloroflexota bacterium]
MKDSLRRIIVEIIGPFALTLIGAGTIIATGGKDLVAIALAHGLAIGLMVAAAGHISGGVYNPALTVGLAVTRKLPVLRAVAYIVAQLAGAILAALVLTWTFPEAARNAVSLGTPALGQGVSAGQGVLLEFVMTFFLMFAVFGTAVDSRGPKVIAGLVIGLVITMDILAGGALTGAAVNPSRAFGVALVSGHWTDQWVWWVGPIVGAAMAALLYNFVLLPDEEAKDKRA